MPIDQKVFLAQYDAIKKIVEEGPCVLVGRCADYVLENYPNVINVFVYAEPDARIQRISRIYDLSDVKAKDLIQKTDKKRASYYKYHTNKEWGDAKNYDLCVNSSKLGVKGTVTVIKEYIRTREHEIDNNIL